MVLTALIFGLLGSFHCIGMCGPIAFLLPVDRSNNIKRALQIISYHLGRIFTYAILGLLFGSIGKSLQLFGMQQQLSIGIGILMILVIIIPAKNFNKFSVSKPIYKVVGKVKNEIGVALKKRDPATFFTIGFLNGLLPCGLVYMAVFGAIAAGGALKGSIYMALFGLGTVPLMTSAIYLGNFLTTRIKQQILKMIPVTVIIVGMLFIIRGLGLGIPYISPSEMVTITEVSAQHSCH